MRRTREDFYFSEFGVYVFIKLKALKNWSVCFHLRANFESAHAAKLRIITHDVIGGTFAIQWKHCVPCLSSRILRTMCQLQEQYEEISILLLNTDSYFQCGINHRKPQQQCCQWKHCARFCWLPLRKYTLMHMTCASVFFSVCPCMMIPISQAWHWSDDCRFYVVLWNHLIYFQK